jgi:hypothetical protein
MVHSLRMYLREQSVVVTDVAQKLKTISIPAQRLDGIAREMRFPGLIFWRAWENLVSSKNRLC